MNPAFVQN